MLIPATAQKAFSQKALGQKALSQKALAQKALAQKALGQQALAEKALGQRLSWLRNVAKGLNCVRPSRSPSLARLAHDIALRADGGARSTSTSSE
ncbi:MAG: hypothetical protein V5A43_00770 [Haloarculaceae archaeon]